MFGEARGQPIGGKTERRERLIFEMIEDQASLPVSG
jgi:hypothetical protein